MERPHERRRIPTFKSLFLSSFFGQEVNPRVEESFPDTFTPPETVHQASLELLDLTVKTERENTAYFKFGHKKWRVRSIKEGTPFTKKSNGEIEARAISRHTLRSFFGNIFSQVGMHTHPSVDAASKLFVGSANSVRRLRNQYIAKESLPSAHDLDLLFKTRHLAEIVVSSTGKTLLFKRYTSLFELFGISHNPVSDFKKRVKSYSVLGEALASSFPSDQGKNLLLELLAHVTRDYFVIYHQEDPTSPTLHRVRAQEPIT